MPAECQFGRPYHFVHPFCGPSIFGQESSLVFDGDEMCVTLGKSGGLLNLDTRNREKMRNMSRCTLADHNQHVETKANIPSKHTSARPQHNMRTTT